MRDPVSKAVDSLWRVTPSIIIWPSHKCTHTLLFKALFHCMHMSIVLACVDLYRMHAWCLQRSEESIGSLELGFLMVVSHHVGTEN